MLDEDKIVTELATRHGLSLKENDPIFAVLLLNRIVLREYLAKFEDHLAESITNVAIKEDVTGVKLRKLLETSQLETRKETERILNQFTDNLQARLQLVSPTPANSKTTSWPAWLVSAFLLGLLTGGFVVHFL